MRQSTAVFFMLSSVLVYSAFPLIGTQAVAHVSPVLFTGLSHLFALLALTTLNAVLIARGRLSARALGSLIRSRRFLPLAIGSGTINAASHASLFGSYIYISSASATALYEVWPVAVVMCIGIFLPRHYARVALRDWLFVAPAIVGVTLLIGSATASGTDMLLPRRTITIGVSLALLAAVLMALSSGLDVVLARHLDSMAAPFLQPIVAQNVVKVFSSTCTLVAYVVFFRPPSHLTHVDAGVTLLAAGTGICVIAFGAVAYHIGNIRAESPTVNLLWYLTPVLSLLWLDVAGVARITAGVALGAILIISANLLLTTRADPQAAYAGTLGGICLSAFFCTYIRGTNDNHYYDMMAAVMGVFAILAAFMLQRVSDKAHRVANATIQLVEAVRQSRLIPNDEKRTISMRVLEYVGAGAVRRRYAPASPVSALQQGVDRDVDVLCRALVAACARVVSFGEMLVLVMLGGLALVITHVSRPCSLIGDLVPPVLTGVLVFLCVRVCGERHEELTSPILSSYRRSNLVSREETPSADPHTPLISVVLLFAVFAIYMLVLVRKYGVPFTIQ